MEEKIKSLLKRINLNGYYVRELGLCYGFDDNVIDDVELVEGAILFHTEYGDVGTFDMLAEFQQKAIVETIKNDMLGIVRGRFLMLRKSDINKVGGHSNLVDELEMELLINDVEFAVLGHFGASIIDNFDYEDEDCMNVFYNALENSMYNHGIGY